MPGWYPDPSGAPGRFRFWDGRGWSQQTADRPGGPPPNGPADQGQQPPRRRGPAIVLGAIALVVVLGLIVFFAVRQLGGGSQPFTDEPIPSSTVSGWDDSSPTASPSPTPTPTPSPSGSETARPLTRCPTGDPLARAAHPSDGRIHGGGLSFPSVSGWEPDVQSAGISWAYDVSSQSKRLEPRWFSLLAVGELQQSDGFKTPQQSAESIMQCVASSSFYSEFVSATDLKSEATKIDGHNAWWIRSDIRIDDPTIEAKGDTVDVIVVDTGNPQSLGMYLSGGTIGDKELLSILDKTVTELQVD